MLQTVGAVAISEIGKFRRAGMCFVHVYELNAKLTALYVLKHTQQR